MEHPKQSAYNKVLMLIYSVLMFLPVVLVFLFFNYHGLDLLMYAGWVLLASSIIIILLAGYEFQKKGGVPEGKHLVYTTVLVDSGIYAVVRHPQYLGFILFVLALVLMSQHWLSVISGVIGSVLFYMDVTRGEEQENTRKFGDDYRCYMEEVPRMNFVVGIIKLLRRRKRKG
jgi:protein-S-isoprenylcysteine O-methyltransferase Ste14